MKYIQRNPEPQFFIDWKALDKNPENEGWKPSWETLRSSKDVKNDLKQSLLSEQDYICCYCEIRIEPSTSHIEHLKPRALYKELELKYTNLLCSCGKPYAKDPRYRDPDRCGNKRLNWYNEQEFVAPLDPTCEKRIVYKSEGELHPANPGDSAAQITIDILNLNHYNLTKARQKVIDVFCDPELSKTDIIKLLYHDGKYHPFYTSIKQIFNL